MIHVTVPSIIMKFYREEDGAKKRIPYLGALHWQFVEMADHGVMAISDCHHGEGLDRDRLLEILKVLYFDYNVRVVRTMRPRGKRIPRSRMIKEGAFAGFYEIRLPEAVPELLA